MKTERSFTLSELLNQCTYNKGQKVIQNSKEPFLLEVKHLKKYFPIYGGLLRSVVANLKAVDGVNFTLQEGKTLGLVGESGCGKSTLGRTILQLLKPTAGEIWFAGKNVTACPQKEMQQLRKEMQIIFQDPSASLNPRMTIQEILLEPLNIHQIGAPVERRKRLEFLMEVVGLRKQSLTRYPHEFSGGQKQRIGIARALTVNPKFIVADEPVSALDVSVQSTVLNLIKDLQKQFGIAFLFISHDLAVIHHISHDVGIMYLGKIVEWATAHDLYQSPKHPYTQALLSSIPVANPEVKSERQILKGEVPSPIHPPSGCLFHTRCPQVKEVCKTQAPLPKNVGTPESSHWVRCHLF